METACYYTFSTVCQTLAGAFGFLVAVVIYRMQRNDQTLRDRLSVADSGRLFESFEDFNRARNEGDWNAMRAILSKSPFSPGFPMERRPQADADRARWLALADRQEATAVRLRTALPFTGLVIAFSLAMIPLVPLIAQSGLLAGILMATDVLLAICCLSMYYDLASGVTE